MQSGTFELLILVFIFLGLQAWWIIPIIIKNNKFNKRGKDLREEIKQLEKLTLSSSFKPLLGSI